MSGPREAYESPLSSRYASEKLLALFSVRTRAVTFRRLWTALARAEHALGLPVTGEQVAALEAHITDIDFDAIEARERVVRHDVMAHIHAYGLAAPEAAPIIHLGATSCFVTDNADLILYRDALSHIRAALLGAVKNLAAFAEKYRALPTLGYTHLQPAQPVTVGKRAALWAQDLLFDLSEITRLIETMPFLGCRGTTGTEASFLELFAGDGAKIDRMNAMLAAEFGFAALFPVSAQTYPRKLDSRILAALSGVAESCYRFAGDIRILQHLGEVEEPFETGQVGSSAMAYKRNPMRSERICSLARYVMVDALNAPLTASAQYLERTLDDSANRRIALPEAFLATDAILRLVQNVSGGLVVNEAVIQKHLAEHLPFLATENLLMESVKRGGDRQALHERIRTHSMAAVARLRAGESCDLLDRLKGDPAFPLTNAEIDALLDPAAFVGRSAEQVGAFLALLPDLSGAEKAEEVVV